jgi:hypothetical protein
VDIGAIVMLFVVFMTITFAGVDLLQKSQSPQIIKMIAGGMFYVAPIPLMGGGMMMIAGARRLAGKLVMVGIGLSALALMMLIFFKL